MTTPNGYDIATKFVNSKIDSYVEKGHELDSAHSYALGAAENQLGAVLVNLEIRAPEVYKMIMNDLFREDV
jgi:hypothetical protein